MTHHSLATDVAIWKRLRDQIKADFGLEDDDVALLDTLDGETDLRDILAKLMREARADKAQADGLAVLIKQMQDRKARLETRSNKIRAMVLNAMCDADIPKLTAPDMTVTRSMGQPSVVIVDEAAVPDEYCRISREPRKADIAKELKAGASFPWARLSNGVPTLTVRGG